MNNANPTSAEATIRAVVRESIEVQTALLEEHTSGVARIAELVLHTLRSGNKLVVFGNGGSAADAQHVAGELVCRFLLNRAALPAIALTTDSSILTAVGNDLGFDQVFARQVEALVRPGDLAVGISTSGMSPNVLNGIIAAKRQGAVTLGFTGRHGGKLRELVDQCFCAPSDATPRIQEAHIVVWHAVCEVVERAVAGGEETV